MIHLQKIKVQALSLSAQMFFLNNDEAIIGTISVVKTSIASKKKILEEKVWLDSNSQGDSHDPLNVVKIFEKYGFEEYAEFKHTKCQSNILDPEEKKIQSGEEILFFARVEASAGKSAVIQKGKDATDEVIVVCPSGIKATLIDGGPLFIALSRSKPRMLLQQ